MCARLSYKRSSLWRKVTCSLQPRKKGLCADGAHCITAFCVGDVRSRLGSISTCNLYKGGRRQGQNEREGSYMADSAAFAGGMGMGWRWVVVAWCAWGKTVWRYMCWGVLAGCGAAFGVFCVGGSLAFNQNTSSGWCSWRACSLYVLFCGAAYQNARNISSRIKLEPGVWPEKRICTACHRFVGEVLVGRG